MIAASEHRSPLLPPLNSFALNATYTTGFVPVVCYAVWTNTILDAVYSKLSYNFKTVASDDDELVQQLGMRHC
jgi:hypothetical protein